jgi:hypothetical protein
MMKNMNKKGKMAGSGMAGGGYKTRVNACQFKQKMAWPSCGY